MDGDFCTGSDVKDYLGVTVTTDDSLFSRLATAATAWIRQFLSRDINLQTYTETLDGRGQSVLSLKNYPIVSIASLTFAPPGQAGITLVQGTDYVFSGRKVSLVGILAPRLNGAIQITYDAGYAAIPWDLQQAAIEIAALYYKRKSRLGEVSKIVGGETISFSQADVPAHVKTNLLQWSNTVPA